MAPDSEADPEQGDLDLSSLEERSRTRWQEAGLHEADPDPGRESFFATYPYSYMNAVPHIGHAYTMARTDFMARFQRMLGKNTLFPFAYHVTGTPIVAAAQRIREGDRDQIDQLLDQGVPEDEIEAFEDPEHWIDYFPEQWKTDAEDLGLMIDWRRDFHTTDLNPYYDAFIRWQFRRLKEDGLVRRGEHPVVWDPEEESVLSDHDRREGEGESPQEHALVKLRDPDSGRLLLAATLRPETMFGQTNVWIDPEETYVEIAVDDEQWVIADPVVDTFGYQFDLERTGETWTGRELVGLDVEAPATDRTIPVLPGTFVSADTGTGIVTSVPSDAPDDYRALRDLQEDPERVRSYDLDVGEVQAIEPVAIIDTPGMGDLPAVDVVEDRGIESQDEREALEEAKDEVYRRGFYEGTMKPELPRVGDQPVQEAKDEVQAWLVDEGLAEVFYELTGEVVSRGHTEGVVKIVDDQWFMAYGEEDWKDDVHRAFDETIRCYPEDAEQQFDHVIDWLDDWACTRATGLGTKLPWDEQWIIESLSDSTIYMAYYTIAHHLETNDVDPEDVYDHDGLFDYVFQGEGEASEVACGTLSEGLVETMREEFLHWYPVDFRNSGKDLIQNHLAFMVFNHVAMFDEEHWPRGISVNGWVTIDGEKMSKSKGNFITLSQALDDFGATATRIALANAGEGLDDANFDREFAENVEGRLRRWHDQVATPPTGARSGELTSADRWLLARLAELTDEAREHYGDAMFRSALQAGFFDVMSAWNRYERRALGDVHEDVWATFADHAIRLVAPIAPHLADDAWTERGHEGSVVDAAFPEPEPPENAERARAAEDLVEQVLDDTRDIRQATGEEPEVVRVFTAPDWKRSIVQEAVHLKQKDELNPGALTGRVMQDEDIKRHGSDAADFAKDTARRLSRGPAPSLDVDEPAVLGEAEAFLEQELGCTVTVHAAAEADTVDHGGKADRAEPGRPGIYVETGA
jgi:leucyl-tRNA synthetase